MKRLRWVLTVIFCISMLGLPGSTVASAASARQGVPTAQPLLDDPEVREILDAMSPADRVGQLFLVTFQGDDVSAESDIAVLVRDYRVGGVVLLPSNGNFQSVPVPSKSSPIPSVDDAGNAATISTPAQIAQLSAALQALAQSPARSITSTAPASPVTSTEPLTLRNIGDVTPDFEPGTPPVTETPTIEPSPTVTPTIAIPETPPANRVPILVALDWAGDDSTFFAGTGGFTPLPSAMAIGATWNTELSELVGKVVGQELHAVGVNLLLGPPLDVLDQPRAGSMGDLDTRTFGGDPYWVGKLGEAFIRGVQTGSNETLVTAAKHFPGQGASDRRPEDEVATVTKSVDQLRQIELAPFASVTTGTAEESLGTTAALMTSHIRYRGFQGNIRQLTPPISLAPELKDLMALREFSDWRASGGVLVSDALGVPALRRYYDPTLQKFPHRQVAQDAFLAGNDLLYLSRFALTENWADQFTAIKETILFFQAKYEADSEFRARVDTSVARIIRMKLRLQGEPGSSAAFDPEAIGKSVSVTQTVARAGLSLIYPGRDELADRMPTAPLTDEKILIFTDARSVAECSSCDPRPLIAPTALEEIIMRFYGPEGTGQVAQGYVQSYTYADLSRVLAAPTGEYPGIENAISEARWIVFASLDVRATDYPESTALRTFLAKRSDSLRDKRLVVFAFGAPYYLDTTEISKLTVLYGAYGRTTPFLETAVRALFREFSPVGAAPVTISGINYELIRRLEPASGQIIALGVVGAGEGSSPGTISIQVGSKIPLETGIILDRNGRPVPDGTPVQFNLSYPAEALNLAPIQTTTIDGRAQTTITLDRPGELWITVQAGDSKDSTRVELAVGGDKPGTIATVVPSPTLEPTQTPTHTSTPPPTDTSTPDPTATPTEGPIAGDKPRGTAPRVTLTTLVFGLLGTIGAGSIAYAVRRKRIIPGAPVGSAVSAVLWATATAWIAYLVFAFGWFPGATRLQAEGHTWVALIVTLSGGLLSLLWRDPREERVLDEATKKLQSK